MHSGRSGDETPVADTFDQVDDARSNEESQPARSPEGVPGPASYVGCLLACFVGLVVLIIGGLVLLFLVVGAGNA